MNNQIESIASKRISIINSKSVVMALFILLSTNGCGRDVVYDAYKCGKVATLLEDDAKMEVALNKVENEISKMSSASMMGLESKFTDDLELYKYSPEGQISILTRTYNSEECQEYYK